MTVIITDAFSTDSNLHLIGGTMKKNIQELKHNETITITDFYGNVKTFQVNIGDALLNGNRQVWLKHDNVNSTEYLRKLPVRPMSIGIALFSSFNDLLTTLKSGAFYFG